MTLKPKSHSSMDDDVARYQRIAAALGETIRLVGEVDEVVSDW